MSKLANIRTLFGLLATHPVEFFDRLEILWQVRTERLLDLWDDLRDLLAYVARRNEVIYLSNGDVVEFVNVRSLGYRGKRNRDENSSCP